MDWFKNQIEHWLGVEPAQAGEGTLWRLDWNLGWPPWVLLLFVIAAVAFVVSIYRREGETASTPYKLMLAGLRLALIILTLFMLSEATLLIDRMGLPSVAVLVDTSGSMSIPDRYRDPQLQEAAEQLLSASELPAPTRLNLAKAVLLTNEGQLLKGLQRDHRLRLYFVAASAQPVAEVVDAESLEKAMASLRVREPAGKDSRSRLGDALRQVLNDLRGTPPSAIVYFTDGITTDGEPLTKAAERARSRNVPLLAVAMGDPEPVRDVELHDLLVDEVVFLEDLVTFQAKATSTGYEGRMAEVQLRAKDSATPLARQTVTLGPDGKSVPVRVVYQPARAGEIDFVLEISPLEGEIQDQNNRLERRISVKDEKIRVLLADSVPRYEFRYLKHLLEREPTIALSTVLQEADPEYAEEDRTALPIFPVNRHELFEFDVVILGDVNPAYLSPRVLSYVAEFVQEKGGGLLMIAGPRFTPLAYQGTPLEILLPVELSGATPPLESELTESFQPILTPEGRASAIFLFGNDLQENQQLWKELPGLFWLFETPVRKPGAVVLATHPTKMGSDGPLPVFVWHFAGPGKVLFHATDDTWRWRFRVGDVYLRRFWLQAVRFLSRAKLIGRDRKADLTAFRAGPQWGDPVRLRVRFYDDALAPRGDEDVIVKLERPGHYPREIRLRQLPADRNVFEGLLTQPAEGSYHAWVASPVLPGQPPATDFRISAPPGEFQQVRTDAESLRQAAQITNGKFYTLKNVSRIAEDVPKGHRIRLDTDQTVPLWNTWLVLALFVLTVLAEWLLRKRVRML